MISSSSSEETQRLMEQMPVDLPLFKRRSRVYLRKSRRVAVLTSQPIVTEDESTRLQRMFCIVAASTLGVLYRYQGESGSAVITIGVPALERDAPVLGSLGYPISPTINAELSCRELEGRTAEQIRLAGNLVGCTYEGLLRHARVNDDASCCPLFSVLLRAEGLHAVEPDLRQDVSATLKVDKTITLELEFNANVLDGETVERFGRHVLQFASQAAANGELLVRSVDYLAQDRSQVISLGRGKDTIYPSATVHELVEIQARLSPELDAIRDGTVVVSYDQLNSRANQVAHYLAGLGVERGARVGLCMNASWQLLVTLIGVMKAGAAVVPIVPTFPAVRNSMAIEDSGMKVLLTASAVKYPCGKPGVQVVTIDIGEDAVACQPVQSPPMNLGVDEAIYVMFTSGSTGRPKGIVMKHGTLGNLVAWQRARSSVIHGERTLQRTSIGFDVSFQEIFATLCAGGTLVVMPDEIRDDVSMLPEYVARHRINRAFVPPVALEQLAVAAMGQPGSLGTLREVIVAGEQLHISMPIRRLFRDIQCAVDNQYGPTETHVATAHRLEGPSARWPEYPPIGKAIDNTCICILDPWRQPVPIGVAGEVYIGGAATAIGYLSTEETAERFVVDPMQSGSGGTMYRTGDRARFLLTGDIEFLGRLDDQVKIRGYRIELGEIESAIRCVPGVSQAAVVVHESDARGRELAAYVVGTNPGTPDATTIRQQLLESLPSHMVPSLSAIALVDALPLTSTGKVNRLALPPLKPAQGSAPDAEGDETERTLQKLWCSALGLESVNRQTDFIEAGGHSLIAIQLVSKINDTFNIALPLRALLKKITLADIAKQVEDLRQRRPGVCTTPNSVRQPVGVASTDVETTAFAGEPTSLEQSPETIELPNHLTIACLHRQEAEYLYHDIFERQTYGRCGIEYPPGSVILDVGAHIGLFAIYTKTKAPDAEIHAIEPCPPIFAVLQRNMDRYQNVHCYQTAFAQERKTARLTYYPQLSGMTSFYPDRTEEKALLGGIIRNLSASETSPTATLARSNEYLDQRLDATPFECACQTLSDFIDERRIRRVDILKVDVQKSEFDVLAGVSQRHWPLIRQVVVEVHDRNENIAKLTSMLRLNGFSVTLRQDNIHRGTAVYFLYGTRIEVPIAS